MLFAELLLLMEGACAVGNAWDRSKRVACVFTYFKQSQIDGKSIRSTTRTLVIVHRVFVNDSNRDRIFVHSYKLFTVICPHSSHQWAAGCVEVKRQWCSFGRVRFGYLYFKQDQIKASERGEASKARQGKASECMHCTCVSLQAGAWLHPCLGLRS